MLFFDDLNLRFGTEVRKLRIRYYAAFFFGHELWLLSQKNATRRSKTCSAE
jgi:hypothetical protein